MRLFVGMLFSHEAKASGAMGELVKEFGEQSAEWEYPFTFTDYYAQEMGPGLRRRWLVFGREIEKTDLVRLKQLTQRIEKRFSVAGKRTVNLDPGGLSDRELVLASGKGKGFKQKLSEEIWAHTVLRLDPLQTFFHTFPEFRQNEVQEFFFRQRPGRPSQAR
jgi:hypothetical protein